MAPFETVMVHVGDDWDETTAVECAPIRSIHEQRKELETALLQARMLAVLNLVALAAAIYILGGANV